jgi:hypothetical protein
MKRGSVLYKRDWSVATGMAGAQRPSPIMHFVEMSYVASNDDHLLALAVF